MTEINSVKIERLVSPENHLEEDFVPESKMRESKLRPKSFNDFPGQDRVKRNLEIYVKSAKNAELQWIMSFFTVLPV